MSLSNAKRFYKAVSVAAVTPDTHEAGYTVLLDGRVLKTPGKAPLITPLKSHAQLIAGEWDAQDGDIKPHTMPITRLFNVTIERTPDNRAAIVAELVKYAGTDLLCYRAEEPVELRRAQDEAWDKWLEWARAQGVELRAVTGVMAIKQNQTSLDKLAEIAEQMSDLQLTLLGHFNAVYGSAVLALAVMRGALAAEQAWDISRIDAQFQIERWGEDEEAAEIAANTRAEIIELAKLI